MLTISDKVRTKHLEFRAWHCWWDIRPYILPILIAKKPRFMHI